MICAFVLLKKSIKKAIINAIKTVYGSDKMNCTRKITDDLIWVGGNDKKLSMFEGYYPVPSGVSYNSYILKDEKTVLFDTVDKSEFGVFSANVKSVLDGRKLDYLVVHHMEPDHSATIEWVVNMYPEVKIVCSQKTTAMLNQFFGGRITAETVEVKEGDTLETGKHTLHFVMAPMVHWPEVMMTYDSCDKILFSADAFGSFGTLDGAVTDEEKETDMDEARRYYTNIVGKYGPQVKAVLGKAASLEINMICPLHGLVLKNGIEMMTEKYLKWSAYEPEEKGVLIAYSSVYGNTENAAYFLACKLFEKGLKVRMFDVSVTHSSYVIAEAFRVKNIVLATTTYNNGIFVTMEDLINELISHNIQNKNIAVIENGSWAPVCGKLVKAKFEKSRNIEFIGDTVTIKSAAGGEAADKLAELAELIAEKAQ